MADRVRPSANGTAANHSFPPTKSQTYSRPAYRPRPPPPKRGHRRGCCCCLCLWLIFLLIALIFLAAIAGAIFYFVYRPHTPSFSVTSLRLSSFNISASNSLTSRLVLNVTALNPNKKLVYIYDPITISASTSDIPIGEGSFPSFTHEARNTTYLRTKVVARKSELQPSEAADLRKKKELKLQVLLETKAGVKVGAVKTKKVRVRVKCTGFKVVVPTSAKKAAAVAKIDDDASACDVKVRVKIWKWYLF